MIKAILYERTVALCARTEFREVLERSERWGDSRSSRRRKETMKTRIRFQNSSKKSTRNLKNFSTRSQRIQFWIEQHRCVAFLGLGHAQYEWRTFGQPLVPRYWSSKHLAKSNGLRSTPVLQKFSENEAYSVPKTPVSRLSHLPWKRLPGALCSFGKFWTVTRAWLKGQTERWRQ